MSKQKQKIKTKKFEFDALLQNIAIKDKGSKSCKDPHTVFTVLTKPIFNEEMDALVYGGCYGAKICLKIEVVVEKQKQKVLDQQ